MHIGGDYAEVGRWLWNAVTAHAKREVPRAEVQVDAEGPREGVSYGVRVEVEGAAAPALELPYADVSAGRGSLTWCAELAARARALARAADAARAAARAGG